MHPLSTHTWRNVERANSHDLSHDRYGTLVTLRTKVVVYVDIMVRRLLLHCKQLPRAFQIIRKKENSIREIARLISSP